jgi:hypothetical protein
MARSTDLKILAYQRRQRMLQDMQDGVSWGDRTIPSGSKYSRAFKYKPQTAHDWEDLEG